jgi:hypothetical protein
MDAAVKLVENLVRKKPDFGGAFDHLARLRKFSDKDAALMRRAEKSLDLGMPPKERCNLLFSLGKMHDDCAKYDKAFSYYEKANLLRKHFFDVEEDNRFSRAICKAFSKKSMEEIGQHGHSSGKPVFVVGMPRSGTTLMERMIAAHPRGAGAGELPEIARIGHRIVPQKDWRRAARAARQALTPDALTDYAQEYLYTSCSRVPAMRSASWTRCRAMRVFLD